MFIVSCNVSILYCRGVQGVMQHAVSYQNEITIIHYTFKSLGSILHVYDFWGRKSFTSFFMFLKVVINK